jgi:TolB-like protein/tetratricopeptide (TPR) repeat protein
MIDSAPPEGASLLDPAARPAASRLAKLVAQLKRLRGPIAAIAAIGAVLSGLVGYWSVYDTVHRIVVPASSPAAIAADAGPLSIAVLPFTNLTGDAGQAYVADGLTASLTSDLSRIRGAFIVNAATAFAYKDKPVTAQQVGKDLGVRFVLHGSVQRSGTKIRINAQLADAASNAQLWSEVFEGDPSDLFALQDQVTGRIGNSIGREMVIVAARESETRQSSPKVADLMLRARALYLRTRTLKNLQQIEELYRQALALEPNNVNAMVGLASSITNQADGFNVDLDEAVRERKFAEGRDLALKAKELDPDNPEVYYAIGTYAVQHGDWEGGLRAAETRLLLDPKNPFAYFNVGHLLYYLGEPQRAIELLIQGINLDPKHASDGAFYGVGRSYVMLGDNDAAIEWLLRAKGKNPGAYYTYVYLALAYALKGEDSKARATAAELRRLDPKATLSAYRTQHLTRPAKYNEWFESKLVPAWRKAGLPE